MVARSSVRNLVPEELDLVPEELDLVPEELDLVPDPCFSSPVSS